MPDSPRSLASAIAALAVEFEGAGIGSARLDARLMVLGAAGRDRLDLVREPGLLLEPLGEWRLDRFRRRRLAREPVSRILGHREFWSLDFEVTPEVLDPRPDTETVVAAALDFVGAAGLDRTPIRILDLGTGCGAILVALLSDLPLAFGVGVDRSLAALEVARRNARRHGVAHRAALFCGSWAGAVAGPFDLIVSNPPYLAPAEIAAAEPEVSRYDPRIALDGGTDGLDAYRSIVADWQRLGRAPIFLEIGATQAQFVVDLISEFEPPASSIRIERYRDLAGFERVVAALPQLRFP